jgi:GMP synthase (glutamine-hydrolysing)
MRKLRPGEPDWHDSYRPGYFKEKGIHAVEIVKRDPLFAGLPRKMLLPEAHYCEVKKLPPGFSLLATNANCRIQAMRCDERPIYGVQFHPEAWTDHYQDGKRIMTNFFRIAGLA